MQKYLKKSNQDFQKLEKRDEKRILKGFLLLEMLISVMVFSLIVLASVAAFASVTKTQKKAREAQKKVESVGVAMELISKIVRMSTQVKSYSANKEIRMYNFSQGKCISYKFSGGNLQEAEVVKSGYDPNTDDACEKSTTYPSASYVTMLSGVTGSFKVIESDSSSNKTGKATISIKAGEDYLQTSVSFMDMY